MVANIERRIAVGVLYSYEYLERIRSKLDTSVLESAEVRQIVRLAFRNYDKIGAVIGDELKTHVELLSGDYDTVKIFFDTITDEEKENVNAATLYADTIRYMNRRKMEILADSIYKAIDNEDIDSAKELLEQFKPVEDVSAKPVPLFDRDSLEAVFSDSEPLFTYSGELGELANKFFARSSFVAILAPEKRGKTWFLIELAMKAFGRGLNVAYFEVGDMSLNKLRMRFLTYISKRPFGKKSVTIPVFDCKLNQNNSCALPYRTEPRIGVVTTESGAINFQDTVDSGYTPCTACAKRGVPFDVSAFPITKTIEPLTVETAVKYIDKWEEVKKERGGDIRLFHYSSGSISASGIDSVLREQKEVDGWIPDVVIIDYADILAPEWRGDPRHQINETWMRLRRLSLDWDALVITATQSDAQGHKVETLDQMRFSEDKRKMAHVTAMLGLNQTEEEKRLGLMRINVIVARDTEFNVGDFAHVLTGFSIGRPILKILDF